MAKFLKSLFQPSDKKRKTQPTEGASEERSDFAPPLDGRRKLSISRSGRMKQNKKRQSLSLDLYGENIQPNDKNINTSREYNLHEKSSNQDKHSNENTISNSYIKQIDQNLKDERRLSIDLRTPEGIDKIFKINNQ